MSRRRILLGALLILGTLAGMGWWQRQPLLAWWRVRQLTQADDASREAWVKRVVDSEEAALPHMMRALSTSDARACANLEAGLIGLTCRWRTLDPRSLTLLTTLRDRWTQLGTTGQASALRTASALLNLGEENELLPVAIAQTAGDLLKAAQGNDALRVPALNLTSALLVRVPPGQWLGDGRRLAQAGLLAKDAEVRVAALHLTLCDPLHSDQEIMSQAAPLLRDADADVRRAAVLALGSATDVVSDDELLPLLHDSDGDVRRLCELALRGRGLQDRHLELARLISDDSPTARLQVLHFLRTGDVEPGVWLRRLSHDPAPAVRAAAIRAAAAQPQVDLRDRLAEMTQLDESPTVRELAGHYLARTRQK